MIYEKKYFKISTVILIIFIIWGICFIAFMVSNLRYKAVKEAERSLEIKCEHKSRDFNEMFSNMEFIVNCLSDLAYRKFTVSHYSEDRAHFVYEKKEMDNTIYDVIINSRFPLGVYFTFDPATSNGWDEIWYVKDRNNKLHFIDSPSSSTSWLDKEVEANEYYFRAIRQGAFWSDVTYDYYMKADILSYIEPAYDKNDALIGVLGIDLLVSDIMDELRCDDEEEKYFSALLDTSGNIIVGNIDEKMMESEEYISATAAVNDSYHIMLVRPIEPVLSSVSKKSNMYIALGILMCMLCICIFIIISQRKVKPMIVEYEQKELLLINNARQIQLGEMVGSIVHQWKRILNIMNMSVLNLKDDYCRDILDENRFYHYTDRIQEMIGGLADTADDFRDFLRPQREKVFFSVHDEIETVVRMLEEQMKIKGINITISGNDFKLFGYKNEFDQCIFNLLNNARDALSEEPVSKRKIRVSIYHKTMENNDIHIFISVENNGRHIEESLKESIFDLYFTTKEDRGGTGIGLYITKKIMEEHFGGKIYYRNINNGVAFIIEFLSAQNEETPEPKEEQND